MTFDDLGIYFHIGSFILPLRYYGIILVTGAFIGGYLSSLEARRKGENPDLVWDGILWGLIFGIIGARLWHILTPPPSMVAEGKTTLWYLQHPLDAIDVRNGGLGLPGAVAGGLFGVFLFTRRHKLNWGYWVDISAPGLALGQAIGR